MFLLFLLRALVFAFFLCRFAEAADPVRLPRIVFMISEAEYDTKTTVPAFAKAELSRAAWIVPSRSLPVEHSSDFPGLDALLPTADLLFVSVRRQAPTEAQMKLIRAHMAAGKPVVGIRTASHAFAPPLGKNPPPAPEGHVYWPEFDHEVLGGNYLDHYGVGIPTLVKIIPEMADHPVLAGIGPEEFRLTSHLYKNPDLPATVTKLMTGRMDGRPEVEPVAWVNTAGGRRVFYTSLGSPQDFEAPQFRRLLRNGIFWALRLPAADAVQGQGKTDP